jgi:hypothetical protein
MDPGPGSAFRARPEEVLASGGVWLGSVPLRVRSLCTTDGR